MLKQPTKSKKTASLQIVIWMLAIFLTALIISKFWFQVILIRGDSMVPTYRSGQFVLIEKISDEYNRDDVVAFKSDELDAVLVKRIVGIPGDKVFIKDQKLYVNDELNSFYKDSFFGYSGILENVIILKEHEFIVIGDNIEESRDSRFDEIGIIIDTQIKGKLLW